MVENQIEHVEAIAVTTNALEQMERASIDIQIATAKKYPRSMDLFYKRAIAMVTFDAETARSCLYRRPVGKKPLTGEVEYAEGESIRMAEIVASSYGNLRIAGMIIEMEPRYVKAIGITHDLESNVAVKKEVVESTVTKRGVPFSERMRVVVAKSALSKAIRDSTFSVIPKSLCKPLVNKAKEVAKGDIKTFDAKRKAVVEWIKKLKIEPKRVWNAVGIKGEADIGVEVLHLLYGLKTAIDEKDITINEAFPKPEAEVSEGSTAERILQKDELKESEKPTRKPRSDKGTKRGNLGQHKKTVSETSQESEQTSTPPPDKEKDVKCPKCGHVGDPAISHTCEQENNNPAPSEIQDGYDSPTEETPTTVGKDTHKCGTCDRPFPEHKLIDGKKCPFCYSLKILELT